MTPLALSLLMTGLPAPAGLAAAPFAQLPTHGAAAKIQWAWPDPALFVRTMSGPITPHRMAHGTTLHVVEVGVADALEAALAAGTPPADALAHSVRDAKPIAGAVLWHAGGAHIETGASWRQVNARPSKVIELADRTALVWADQLVVVEGAPLPGPEVAPAQARLDWTYATTLLVAEPGVYAADRGARRVDGPDEATWAPIEQAMQARPAAAIKMLAQRPLTEFADSDWRLGQIARFYLRHGENQRAFEVYQRFQPMGRCSMDTAPADTARSYADACYAAGRIGCFLQLQVRIMGDRFARRVWSSYGEAAAATQSGALTEAGVDAGRFLRGLLLDYATDLRPRESIGMWRLARSMHESGVDFGPDLRRLATDPQLDPANRHRAAQALWLLERRAKGKSASVARPELAELSLLPASRAWIDAVEAASAQ